MFFVSLWGKVVSLSVIKSLIYQIYTMDDMQLSPIESRTTTWIRIFADSRNSIATKVYAL